ncbi:glycoside hydrolase family 15 protein [Georgenia sp. AZ-5]|uniref:glycoside hydrolase family 15 protein n=1 Tax=Georgenia sp. AZ-5 TaxID=3367526 RepID=UPI0037553009
MSVPIADHALIGDTHTGALVTLNGTITWLCLPRFDSPACFASLLGDEGNGEWALAPAEYAGATHRYHPGTLVLETEFAAGTGTVRLTDFMPHRHDAPTVVRIVEGLRGSVQMRTHLRLRFDYGRTVPWVRADGEGLSAVAGSQSITVECPVPLVPDNGGHAAQFTVRAGDVVPFMMTWREWGRPAPTRRHAKELLLDTIEEWTAWSSRLRVHGPWADIVSRSLITLKALTYEPSGALVAAPTTSLPEQVGGVRNWDYRYTWLRDASFVLDALTGNGCLAEAIAWRNWLLRAVAGDPAQLQIVYGLNGERWLPELALPWLAGHRGSVPVRVGNGAAEQFQLDVYGEVLAAMHAARQAGMRPDPDAWALQRALVEHVALHWREPDEGIWEVRGGRRHFVHSKVMAWVAFDRAARAVVEHGLPGDADRYRHLADQVHTEVCHEGYDPRRGTFVQSYGSASLDASLLLLPAVGFLPATDDRVVRTVDAIAAELTRDGFVQRYLTDPPQEASPDGLGGPEGSFLLCTFWLVDALALRGDYAQASRLFERAITAANDVGLLAEEYDPVAGEPLGNFPQAFSHVGLVNSARLLAGGGRRALPHLRPVRPLTRHAAEGHR